MGDTLSHCDAVLGALADVSRRRLVAYLREHGDATRGELADVLTGWLAVDRDSGVADPADRERARIVLSHVHIPVLADAGLVETDDDTETIGIADLPPWVEACLDAVLEGDQSTDRTAETDTA